MAEYNPIPREYKQLGETYYCHIALNSPVSASADDGSSHTAHVRKCGDAASAAPIFTVTPALLTHATYKAGKLEVAIPVTEANGFEYGQEYVVFADAITDGTAPGGVIGRFYT